jgi:DNA-binding NarL/FixJ family response regulator
MPITVLLASDAEVERQSILRLLKTRAEIQVVGEATNFPQAMQMSNDLKPQIVLMDLHMPNDALVSPVEVKTLLNSGASRLLVISLWRDEEANVLANNFGAYTLLNRRDLGNQLIPAIFEKAAQLRAKASDNS